MFTMGTMGAPRKRDPSPPIRSTLLIERHARRQTDSPRPGPVQGPGRGSRDHEEKGHLMQIRDFIPQVLPHNLPSLAGGVPPAPPGTIFVKAGPSGFAVPPRKFTLHFGRAEADVHVVFGGDDEFVSRLAASSPATATSGGCATRAAARS